MDVGINTTGLNASSMCPPSGLQYLPQEWGPMPPRICIGAPQASALALSSAPIRMPTRVHTVPHYIASGPPTVAVSLPQRDADVNQEEQHGDTALLRLVDRGELGMARLLIDAGANPAYRNHAGDCAVDLAMAQGQFLEAAAFADKAAAAASTSIKTLLGMLNTRITIIAASGSAPNTADTSTATTASATTISVPAASVACITSGSTTSIRDAMENAFKAVANDDLAALESILPALRREVQDDDSQHARAQARVRRNWACDPESALLKMAACLGRLSLIPALLDNGALLEHVDGNGDTALILAARHGHMPVLKLLLRAGADMEHGDVAGWTALIHAIHVGNDEIVAMLLARGASMVVRNREGALLMAVALEHSDDKELRLLSRQALKRRLQRRPTVAVSVSPSTTDKLLSKVFKTIQKKDAQSLGQQLAQISNYRININRELRCLREPDASNHDLLKNKLMTPLMLAAFSGDEDVLELLLDAGADIAQSGSSGMTALMWAAVGGHTAAVEAMLDSGKLNKTDAFGATALMHAVESRVVAVVQALIDAGADVNHATTSGRTALMCAVEVDDIAIIKALLRAGAKTDQVRRSGKTALHSAVRSGHIAAVKALLKARAGVDHASKNGWTALMFAVMQGNNAILKALLQAGARPDLARPRGMTALMYAAEKGHAVALRLLLGAGAAVDQVNGNGASALMCAAYEGQDAGLKVLLEAGADFRLEADDVGYTAMRIASMRGHVRCIELLRAKGADSNPVDE